MSNQGSSQDLGKHPGSALLGADCEPCSTCGALPCDQVTPSKFAVDDAIGVIRRLVFRLEDLLEIARQWEPDHSSGEHLAQLFFAREARSAARDFLTHGTYRQAGTGETLRDQPRLTALSDGALGRQDGPDSGPGMNPDLPTPQPEQLHGEEQ